MAKQKAKKTDSALKWNLLALISILIAIPNSTAAKVLTNEMDPAWINVLRFLIVAVMLLPFTIRAIPAMTRTNVKYAILQGLIYAICISSFYFSVSLGQASYTAAVGLGIPVMLVVYSIALTREKVSRRAVLGMIISALGAFILIGAPLLSGHGLSAELPLLATILALVNVATFPLSIIMSRKATDNGLPASGAFGIAAVVTLVIVIVIALFTAHSLPPVRQLLENPIVIGLVLYMGVAVSIIGRMLTSAAYKHLGSAITGGLYYVEGLMAMLLPALVLSERITPELFVGGLLIIAGMIISETHRHPTVYHKDHHAGHRYM